MDQEQLESFYQHLYLLNFLVQQYQTTQNLDEKLALTNRIHQDLVDFFQRLKACPEKSLPLCDIKADFIRLSEEYLAERGAESDAIESFRNDLMELKRRAQTEEAELGNTTGLIPFELESNTNEGQGRDYDAFLSLTSEQDEVIEIIKEEAEPPKVEITKKQLYNAAVGLAAGGIFGKIFGGVIAYSLIGGSLDLLGKKVERKMKGVASK